MIATKRKKPKWRMSMKLERIDGKPLTKADKVLLDGLVAQLRAIDNAEVELNGFPEQDLFPLKNGAHKRARTNRRER